MNKKQKSILDLINDVIHSVQTITTENREISLLENPDVNSKAKLLGNRIKIKENEAIIFAVLFEKMVNHGSINRSQLIKTLRFKFGELQILHKALGKLRHKMLISINSNPTRPDMIISIPTHIQNNIFENKRLVKPFNKFTQYDFEKVLSKLFDWYSMQDELADTFYEEIRYYLKYHNNLPIVKFVNRLTVPIEEKIIVLYGFISILRGFESFNVGRVAEMFIFPSANALAFKQSIIAGESDLIEMKILHPESNDFKMSDNVRLSNQVLKEIFGDYKNILPVRFNEESGVKVIKHESIVIREMFYNDLDEKQVNEIHRILIPENYNNVKLKLAEQKLLSGICILLYGLPGTGKTETVYQIAHHTKRDVITLDISQMRDKYVGESEKLIRKVFGQYRSACMQTEGNIPILLMNEADSVIARRRNVETSVDQMNNSMQNILLEELEKFDGIFMATTNLPQNFDVAFERRFLFKIKFNAPNFKTRLKIIQSHFGFLNEADAIIIATNYQLSGAQIQNLNKKFTMHNLLHNCQPSIEVIRNLCQDYSIPQQSRHVIKGFFEPNRLNK